MVPDRLLAVLVLCSCFLFNFVGWGVEIINLNGCHVVGHNLWGFFPSHSWELNITNWSTTPVRKDELLWFILAEFVYSGNDGVGHWDDIPTAPYDFLHG
jgi:hypothetical protein